MNNLIQMFDDKTIFNSVISPWIKNPEDWAIQVKNLLEQRIAPQFEKIRCATASWSNTYLPIVRISSILGMLESMIDLNNTVFYADVGLPKALIEANVAVVEYSHKASNDLMLMRKFRELISDKNISESHRYTVQIWLDDCFEEALTRPRRSRINKMYDHIARLTRQFLDNIRQASEKTKYSLVVEPKDAKLLNGLAKSTIDIGRHNANVADRKGFVFYPDEGTYDGFMSTCESRILRRRMFYLHSKLNSDLRIDFNNDSILRKILQKKQFVAKMYGYDSYANLVLSRHVIPNVAKANTYLDGLLEQVAPLHAMVMQDCKMAAIADGLRIIRPWDIPFYYEKVRKEFANNVDKKFSDHFRWRDFFPKLLKMLEQQFDLKITKIKEHPLLLKDRNIQMYNVLDNQSSRAGVWVIDPMVRIGKCDDYWFEQELREHHPLSKGYAPIFSYVSFQLARGKGNPSMSHGEVACILHEMGHCLDAFFSKRDGSSLISSNMGWDLIEMPSKFLEHWSYDKDVMRRLSKHYVTGESISASLISATFEDEQAFQGYNMYSDIMGYRETLFLHHHFSPYSKKAPSRIILANLQKEGIFLNVARNNFMASNHHEYEYGPCGYVYIFAGSVAFKMYQQWQSAGGIKSPKNARSIFTKIFHPRSVKPFIEHLEQYVDMTSMNALEYLKKNLPIEIYGCPLIKDNNKDSNKVNAKANIEVDAEIWA